MFPGFPERSTGAHHDGDGLVTSVRAFLTIASDHMAPETWRRPLDTRDTGVDLRTYRDGVRRWLRDSHDDLERHRVHGPGPIEESLAREAELQRVLWDAGWSRTGWPEPFGGSGGTLLHRATLYEELARAGVTVPEALTTAEVMGPAMIDFAPELARAHLPAYLRGDEGWCQGFSEPDAGSDLAGLRVTARPDADTYVISGQKTWSSLATGARWCFLLARTGDAASRHRGLSTLFVDLDHPRVTVLPVRAATGRNEFAEIFFDDLVVPAGQLVGAEGQGWAIAMSLLQWERGMYGWQRQAILHRRLEELVGWAAARDRTVDGSRLGEVALTLASLRAAARRTVHDLADGRQPGPAISANKLLLAEAEVQTFDLIRSTLEPDVELADDPTAARLREEWFYSRAASIYGGTAEIQRNILADRVLHLPSEVAHG